VENGIEWHAPVRFFDFLHLSRVRTLEVWHNGWDNSNMGKYAYSIWPVVSFLSWFRRFDGVRQNRRPSHHLLDKQDDGKSFRPQESSGTNRYREKSHFRLFTGL
jgi:hypothetical protein